MFDPVDPKQSLPAMEHGILRYWQESDVFKRSLRQRKHGEHGSFSFYDGPPFATGLPHYGHLLAGTIKDVIPRYQTMRGKYVERRFGWDCHGLPIENLIEQEHKIGSKQEIEAMGVGTFNDLCRQAVQRYTKEWRKVVERMGRWVDMDWDYRTMDPDYMESMWWAFKRLYDQKLIYEGWKSMHVCTRCVTPLSNFEVTQGYRDRTDMSVIMTFPLANDPQTVLLAWTTTPWSLPGNIWLLIGPEIEYVQVREKGDDRTFILARKLVPKVFDKREHEIVGTVSADSLVGKRYQPLFPYFVDKVIPSTAESAKPQTYGDRCFTIMLDEHGQVSDEDGTGIVHITNAHGEDGFEMAKKLGIDVLHHINLDGSFKPECTDFVGLRAKPEGSDPHATDKAVIANLKERGRHFSSYSFTHSYPHCWRCDTPLLNYATSSWFVAVEKLKTKMLGNKEKTSWVPAHIKDGRFGKWLEGARDWAISRNRYWGTPLPIWQSPQGDQEVLGSCDELQERQRIRYTKVTGLRHGESEGNLTPVYQCIPPGTDLTATGRKQAQAAGAWLTGTQLPVQVIYCSPLARCRQTAEAVAKATGAPIVIDDRLRETQFGSYEGKTIDFSDLALVKAKRAHKFASNSPESIYHFAGMETWAETNARTSEFLAEMLPKHRGEHVVVVTHADPLNCLKHFFTQEDPMKLSHQPYPEFATPVSYHWDHDRQSQMDLHKDRVDDVTWPGSPSDETVHLTLARHGETPSNVNNTENGWLDEPLTEKGLTQAAALAKTLQKGDYDVLVCSDLQRARQTAEVISQALGLEITGQWQELRERNTGHWQGQTREVIHKSHPPVEDGIVTTSFLHLSPPDGETLSEFLARADAARRRLRAEFPGKRVLAVTHGGMIRALHALEQNLTYREAAKLYPQNAKTYPLPLHPLCRRIPEVLDCWFESGSMPYSQAHFPFAFQRDTKKSDVPPGFPAEFIAEGIDQTRAWFYVLMVLSTALFGDTPFKNVVVNGIVLAEDGKKMSKRLKNYPEPMEIVEKYGADAIRFTLMVSPAVRGEDLRMSERLVEESMRAVLLPLWNTYSFFVTYANAAGFEAVPNRRASQHPLDRWIRAEIQDLTNRMTEQLDRYDLSATCAELHETIDALTNWYVRLSRRRFAGKNDGGDDAATREEQTDALHTLYDVLLTLSQVLAPFCPYMTDAIYLNLTGDEHGSVHLTDWPATQALTKPELALLAKTRLQRQIVSLGLSVRSERKVKVRQPLADAVVALPTALAATMDSEDIGLLEQELNVKSLTFAADPGTLAEAFAQVDARKTGPRFGGRVQAIIKAGKAGEFTVQKDGSVLILDETLAPDEVKIVYRSRDDAGGTRGIAADRGVVVSIDTALTPELEREGQARDVIRGVQQLRKDAGLAFTDRIHLQIVGVPELLESEGEVIARETNATLADNDGVSLAITVGDTNVTIRFIKIS